MEVEAADDEQVLPADVAGWNYTRDGSLRGVSAEYVLSKPMSLADTMSSITLLREKLAPVKLDWSFRTSVHVHVNVQGMTKDQVDCFIYTYLLLEEVLVNFCGEGRKNNRFCLRVRDAEDLVHTLSTFFSSNDWYFPPRDRYRYSSINLDAMAKFGSLEFRAMRGTIDKDVLDVWVNALVRIRSFSMKYKSPAEIAEVFATTPDEEFMEMVFGKAIAEAITPKDGNLSMMLSDTYSLTMALLLAKQGIK